MTAIKRICLVPQVHGVGGMVSFKHKFSAGLAARGIEVTDRLEDRPYDAVLVIGGTRQLGALRRARNEGIPIVQRLNGMNWLHKRRRTGLRHYLRAEYGNLILSTIRKRLATHIVYQSEFVRGWWGRAYGPTAASDSVVHNGVDLDMYSPQGAHTRPEDRYRLLLVEGSLAGGYETGLETGVRLAETIARGHDLPLELMVVGKVSEELKRVWTARAQVSIVWAGLVDREAIPALDRSAHLLFAADLNAACPNAVIEALACGLPVGGFDTGALAELVPEMAGRIAPYGGNPWQLDPPDVDGLAARCVDILLNQEVFRAGAREYAEAAFSLDAMVEKYLQALSR